jgi:hypothetical protein
MAKQGTTLQTSLRYDHPALALAMALAVWRRVSARRGEVEPAL